MQLASDDTPNATICLMIAAGLFYMIISSPVSAAESSAARLYQDYCSVCHGERGDGASHARLGLKPPPRDFSAAGVRTELTRERMVAAVRDGVPGTAMAAWGSRLSQDQVEAIVDYVRREFMGVGVAGENARGREIYHGSCSVCHGDRGAGAVWGRTGLKSPPRDFTASGSRTELTRERMIAAVAKGVPGTPMPAFARQLSEPDIAAVVDFVRAKFMAGAAASGSQTAPEPAAAVTAEVVGDSVGDRMRGKAFYLQNCATCHGARGDGAGPRAYFIFPKPVNFLSDASRTRFDRRALTQSIAMGVRGREMPAWSKVLDDQQIADVAEFVFTEFIQNDEVSIREQN